MRRLPLLALALLAAASLSCSQQPLAPTAPEPSPSAIAAPDAGLARAVAVQERVAQAWLRRADVAGLAVGLEGGAPVLLVFLERVGGPALPAVVDGVPVRVEVTGAWRPFALTDRVRPLPIGISAGNANECLPGTIGCVLERADGHYLLSANHVFARQNQAAIGEKVVQPSRPDSDPACGLPPPNTVVAELADFQPVVYDGRTPNLMDAAVARITADEFVCSTPPGYYGKPSEAPAAPEPRLAIQKLGRTTELTHAVIRAINARVKITFPAGTALFVGQIVTSNGFGAFGDSGALAVTDDGTNRPVGMVIGGNMAGSAIVNPIGPILERFGATICDG